MNDVLYAVPIGIGATALMDTWGLLRQPLFDIPRMDLALVGRWFGRMASGEFRHESIMRAAPVPGERLIGWTVHYLIGLAFAVLLIALAGTEWVRHPTPAPAIVVGIATTAAPILLMQPAMGTRRTASGTSRVGATQIHSLVTHTIYGLGLYLAGVMNRALFVS